MKIEKNTRRKFLKNTATIIAGFSIVPRHVLGKGFIAPSDQLTKGIIGLGGMGRGHIGYAGTRVVAICDIDKNHLLSAEKLIGGGVKTFHNHQELIALPEVDIVHIATPPHWHGIMAVDAAKAGKDIWCEKPMTRTIGEGKKVVEAVKEYKRMFRLNTWFRFEENFYGMNTTVKPIKKLVESGLLGWPLTEQQHPDACGTFRKITYTYADGCKIILDGEATDPNAAYIEGPKGKLFAGFKSDIPNLKEKIAMMPDPAPQVTNFLDAVKYRTPFALNESNGFRSCTMINMGKIALQLGRTLHFDPDTQEFLNDTEANFLINPPMRGPWSI